MNRYHGSLLVSLLLAAPGCVPFDEGLEELDSETAPLAIDDPGGIEVGGAATPLDPPLSILIKPQGEPLLGTADPDHDHAEGTLYRARVGGVVTSGLRNLRGRIVNARGAAIPRLRMDADVGDGTIELDVVATSPDPRGRPMYLVRVVTPAGLLPYCPAGWASATYALPGFVTARGAFISTLDGTAFACPGSPAYKAMLWNYVPYEGVDGEVMYRAALRMARADFCGDGETHTLEGTRIGVADRQNRIARGIAEHPGSGFAGDYKFEAAWYGENRGNDWGGAFCISKWRYQSLPADACGFSLPEPRQLSVSCCASSASGLRLLSTDACSCPVPEGKFCEDYARPNASLEELLAALRDAGADTFSFSRDLEERGVWTWTSYDPATNKTHFVSTDEGNLIDASELSLDLPPDREQNVVPRYFPKRSYQTAEYVGSVIEEPREDLVPLRLVRRVLGTPIYRTTTDENITDRNVCTTVPFRICLATWVEVAVLGYVRPVVSAAPSPAGRKWVLVLGYYNETLDQYRLFRSDQLRGLSRDWKSVRFEGWLLD